ncbi:MAG: SIMPL domain-containing protein [Planctomycetota bacterium]|nr:SIMPL domain-containing protein [Planctomycetota bacterium]
MRGSLVWVAVVLAVGAAGGLVTSTLVASRAYRQRYEETQKGQQALAVTGSARRRIVSDLAVWRITVRGEGTDLKAAYNVLQEGFDRVKAFLEAQKFTADENSVGPINTTAHYARTAKGQETCKVEQYSLERTFCVTSPRLTVVTTAAAEVTELIKDGVQVVSAAPEYHYTKLGELKVEMLGEASRDARTRAEQIASNAGCMVTQLRDARMGVMQITRPYSTEVSNSGLNDSTSIEKDVTAVVALSFGLSN